MILARKLLASAAFAGRRAVGARRCATDCDRRTTVRHAYGLHHPDRPGPDRSAHRHRDGCHRHERRSDLHLPDHRWKHRRFRRCFIYHEGSGILFTAGGSSLGIGNFVIDTAALLVTGDVTANGTDVGSVSPFHHRPEHPAMTADAAGAFTSIFGAPNLTGANVGFASIECRPRPYLGQGPG